MKKYASNAAIAIKDVTDLKRMQSYLKFNNYRAYILFMIGLGTGYRGSDLICLTVGDLRQAVKTKELSILEQKTQNTRKIPFKRKVYLNEKLIEILKEFISGREDSEYIYSSKKGMGTGKYKQHIRRDSLGKVFKKAAIECGIANISIGTHTPRKTYGYIQYVKSGKDINYVQELFGHSSSKVTKSYIGIVDDMLKESAKNIDEYMQI